MKELISRYGLQMICLGPPVLIITLALIIVSLERLVGKEIGYWFRKEDKHGKSF